MQFGLREDFSKDVLMQFGLRKDFSKDVLLKDFSKTVFTQFGLRKYDTYILFISGSNISTLCTWLEVDCHTGSLDISAAFVSL